MSNFEAYEQQLTVADIAGHEFMELMGGGELEEWQSLTAEDVRRQMPEEQVLEIGSRATSLVVVEPSGRDFDEENAITLGLPHKNGWSPQHYIRARILQQAVAPDSRVIVFPNDSFGNRNNRYTKEDKYKLSEGDGSPVAWTQMTALEGMAKTLGLQNVWATGYSKGARQALELAAVGSSVINVAKVNADEAPSKEGRGAIRLFFDFMTSGSDVGGAAREAGIPALRKIMNPYDLNIDFIKFGLAHLAPDTVADVKVMTGSIGTLLSEAIHQVGPGNIKLGRIEGSKLFDPESIPEHLLDKVRLEYYEGEDLFGHATGDNVVLHAAMANRGLTV